MSFDAKRDHRRLQIGMLVSAILVALVALGAVVQERRAPWRRLQAQYASLGIPSEILGIRELRTPDGRVDRCATCHLGALEPSSSGLAQLEPSSSGLAQLEPRSSGLAQLEPHPVHAPGHEPERIGCTACHGGTGRALEAAEAHALVGTSIRDPLLTAPYQQASCSACHVPGAKPGGERVARGAELYLRLGCAMCHPLAAGGRGGWDYGPDLRALGRQSSEALRTSLFEPAADYPRSTMPAYERTLKDDPEALTDLIAFLHGLTLPQLELNADRRVDAPCVRCHNGPRGVAQGRFEHRCSYLVTRGSLACAGCHDPAVPAGQWCPLIREHRDACLACHPYSRGGAVTRGEAQSAPVSEIETESDTTGVPAAEEQP